MESIARLQQHVWTTSMLNVHQTPTEVLFRKQIQALTEEAYKPILLSIKVHRQLLFYMSSWQTGLMSAPKLFTFFSKVKCHVMSQALMALKSGGTLGVAA